MSFPVGAPRPRALLVGLSGEEVAVVSSLAGSVTVTSDPASVHPEEHDVLIVTRSQFTDYMHMYPRRLVFAPGPVPKPKAGLASASSPGHWSGGTPLTKMQTQHTPARDFTIAPDAKRLGLERLVQRSCLPEPGKAYTGFKVPTHPDREAVVLALEVLEKPLVLAAILENRTQAGKPIDSSIWLPELARSAFREWVQFAFAHWREDVPALFPIDAEWKRADAWASVEESDARKRLVAFDTAESARREAADAERRGIVEEVEKTQTIGDAWRHLLTETDAALVAAVKDALEMIGFVVQDADELPQHKGAKREDLRVSDGEWTTLAEVKGYTGAAKSNDLAQVSRAAAVYAMDQGRLPDALWYIPNMERGIDPAQRAVALAGREDDLRAFADTHDGCLIDTRELFALRQRLASGEIGPVEARESLKSARVRFTVPPSGVVGQ